jgi:hypothetical protein
MVKMPNQLTGDRRSVSEESTKSELLGKEGRTGLKKSTKVFILIFIQGSTTA